MSAMLLSPILFGGPSVWAEQPMLTGYKAEFTIAAPNAHRVLLTGEFNNWSAVATPLSKGSNGTWATTLPLPAGRHQYKFIVDGKWMPDPVNTERVDDLHGGKNSVIVVGPPMQPVNLPPSTNSPTNDLNPYGSTSHITGSYQVQFTFASPDARNVSVAGDFNGWSATATPMHGRPDGGWSATMPLPAGRYQYKIVVDGKSIPDPQNPLQEDDGHGGKSSVVVIGQ